MNINFIPPDAKTKEVFCSLQKSGFMYISSGAAKLFDVENNRHVEIGYEEQTNSHPVFYLRFCTEETDLSRRIVFQGDGSKTIRFTQVLSFLNVEWGKKTTRFKVEKIDHDNKVFYKLRMDNGKSTT